MYAACTEQFVKNYLKKIILFDVVDIHGNQIYSEYLDNKKPRIKRAECTKRAGGGNV